MSADDVEPGPEAIDLEALDIDRSMLRHARTATFAPNWKLVLLADAMVGLIIMIAGWFLRSWISVIGWIAIGAGLFYVFLVIRRALQWRWIRRRAGLGS